MAEKSLILRIRADGQEARNEINRTAKEIDKLFEGSGAAGRAASGIAKGAAALGVVLEKASPYIHGLIDGATKAVELANFAAEQERMLASAGTKTLDALRAGTQGLVSDTNLLRVAATATKGDLALSAEQLNMVAQAAVALSEQGFGPVTTVLNELTKALRKGEVEGLTKYGIVLDQIPGRADRSGAALVALGRIALESGDKISAAGREIERGVVRLENGLDRLKRNVGNKLNDAVDQWYYLLDGKAGGGTKRLNEALAITAGRLNLNGSAFRGLADDVRDATTAVNEYNKAQQKATDDADRRIAATQEEWAKRDAEERARRLAMIKGWEETAREKAWNDELEFRRRLADMDRDFAAIERKRVEDELAWEEKQHERRMELLKQQREEQERFNRAAREAYELRQRDIKMQLALQGVSFGGHIGRSDETAKLTPVDRLRQAWQDVNSEVMDYGAMLAGTAEMTKGLAQATAGAMQAMWLQQEGAGDVMKDYIKGVMRAMNLEFTWRALWATGLALVDTFLAPHKAAAEWAAAAAFTAGAIATGGLVAWGGPTSAERDAANADQDRETTSGRAPSSGSSDRNGDTNITIQIGSGFVGDEKKLGREINRAVNAALASGTAQPAPKTVRRAA